MIVENEENNKHQDSQGYRRKDVVWGGVEIKNTYLPYETKYRRRLLKQTAFIEYEVDILLYQRAESLLLF